MSHASSPGGDHAIWSLRDEAGDPLPREPERGQRIPAGTVVGNKYQVGEPIGRGAYSTVYSAMQDRVREVALKVSASGTGDDALRERFAREARFLAAVDHPNVVRVYELGWLETGAAAIAMERLHGVTLQQRLDATGPLDAATLVAIVLPLLDALAVIHERGIVHRDLKPGNVFLCPGAGRGAVVPRLLDFGIGKELSDADPLTAVGRFVGTPAYLAPEQLRGREPCDARTDLHTIGVLLFQALTGRVPFVGSAARVVAMVVRDPAPRLSSLRPDVSPALDAVVARALSKDPADRFASAADMGAAVAAAVRHGPPGAGPG